MLSFVCILSIIAKTSNAGSSVSWLLFGGHFPDAERQIWNYTITIREGASAKLQSTFISLSIAILWMGYTLEEQIVWCTILQFLVCHVCIPWLAICLCNEPGSRYNNSVACPFTEQNSERFNASIQWDSSVEDICRNSICWVHGRLPGQLAHQQLADSVVIKRRMLVPEGGPLGAVTEDCAGLFAHPQDLCRQSTVPIIQT